MLFQALAIAWATAHGAIIQDTATIRNPTLFSYTDELVRLPLQLPLDALQSLCVRDAHSGAPLPLQVDAVRGEAWVLISTLGPGAALRLGVTSPAGAGCAAPAPAAPAGAAFEGGALVLRNGLVEVALPSAAAPLGQPPPPPFLGLAPAAGAPMLGASLWNLTAPLAARWEGNFSCTLLAAGPLFAEAALLYGFAGGGSAQWRVRLVLGQRGAQVGEAYEGLDVSAGVDLALHRGAWAPALAVSNGWAFCDTDTPDNPSGMNATTTQQWAPLAPQGRLPSGGLGLLVARWSQSCDAKFFWGVADGREGTVLGVLGVRGGEWLWPQYRSQAYDTQRWHLMGPCAWCYCCRLNLRRGAFPFTPPTPNPQTQQGAAARARASCTSPCTGVACGTCWAAPPAKPRQTCGPLRSATPWRSWTASSTPTTWSGPVTLTPMPR
jgi:hypothetical protein